MRRVYHWQPGISRRSWKGMHLLKILRRISKSRWIITSKGESDWRLSCISRYLSVNLGMQFVLCTKHLWMKYRDRRVWYELDFRQSTRRNCWSGSYITCIEFITALRNPHIVFKIILEVWNPSSLTPASLEKIHTIPFFSLFYLFLLNYRRGFLLCGTPRFFLNRGKGMLGLETWYCWLRPLETFLHGNSWQSIAAFWPFWDCGKVQLEMPKKKKNQFGIFSI